AVGVHVIDRNTKQTREYAGRLIFLCASTLGTAQILLNSKTPRFPTGLANSSGEVGHNLMDHISKAGASGTVPGLEDKYDPIDSFIFLSKCKLHRRHRHFFLFYILAKN